MNLLSMNFKINLNEMMIPLAILFQGLENICWQDMYQTIAICPRYGVI